jgi:hypothetical protein
VLAGAFLIGGAAGAELKKETADAFENYIRSTETRLDRLRQSGQFLWVDGAPERQRSVRAGKVLAEPVIGKGDLEVRGGLIHDWIGAVFIPGATIEKTLAFVQDYNNHKKFYKPEVIDSKLLAHNGTDFQIFLRLLKKKVITVVLDTYHDVHYVELDPHRWHSISKTTKITEVEGGDQVADPETKPGEDHGFLWRLDSYWRFEERDGGVYVECEAVSLTRDVPTGLGWLINPIVRGLPRESLANTLRETRDGLGASR